MYSLKEAWDMMLGEDPVGDWDGKMYCNVTNRDITFSANNIRGYLSAYTFTLVTKGWLAIDYNGRKFKLHPDDLYVYSPGLPVEILDASADYEGVCLLADEDVTFETPIVHDLLQIAYMPIVQLHEPKQTLPHEDARRLMGRMKEMTAYIHSGHLYKKEILRMLYGVFLLDLQGIQQQVIEQRPVAQRVEEIFIGFIRLLPKHFIDHHDLAFYADSLNISTVYLSRVVREVSGRTVAGYVNQMLVMEASFLLRTSQLSIAQIADRLHFADTPSFSKFFLRLKGLSPREFRQGK